MKKELFIILILGILILPTIYAEETHNVIIKYKEPSELKSSAFSIQSSFNIDDIPKEKIRHNLENGKSATLTTSQINDLKKYSNIEILEIPQRKISMQDAIYLTNSTNIWQHNENNINITGKGETICIIDTGINYNHSDFGNCYGNNTDTSCKIIGGWDYCADDTTCSTHDWNPIDVNGHGTHVAGIAAANGEIKGIAPESKIVAVKIANSTGTMWDDDIEAGIRFCINNADEFNISIISMSLGGGSFSDYCDTNAYDPSNIIEAINDATKQNITITIATGNDDYTNNINFPACIENATRIGSITKSNLISSFTNRDNSFTDLLLSYGSYINSTSTPSKYAISSGTSMSTPMAAGMIALLKQYKKLESNKTLTNDEVKEILINSSEKYYDSPSNGNYSIINSLAAILYSDEQPPQIESTPNENLLTTVGNQTFFCNATDNLQLKNLTLQIYNSTDLIYNLTNTSVDDNTLTINQSIDLATTDTFTWNCFSYDNQSNYATTNNKTITTYLIHTEIISPTNNTFTTQNETDFNCSIESSEELSNITFSIYNSTSLLYNATKNITGLSNYSTFNYTLPNETTYYYNCLAINNLSYSDQTPNHTITYDITSPQINLTSPANNSRITSPVTFTYSQTEANPDFCNLTINSEIKTQTSGVALSDDIYYWNITCTDKANNSNTSETFKLEIYTEPTSSGGGGGGGSSTTPRVIIPETYTLTEEQSQSGTQQELKEKESVNFKIKSQDHKLTLNEIYEDRANITIESDPRTITIYLNSPTKINLDEDETFDLELILIETNDHATIFIKEINETIPTKHILIETQNETFEAEQIDQFEEDIISSIPRENFFKRIKNAVINFFKKIFKF